MTHLNIYFILNSPPNCNLQHHIRNISTVGKLQCMFSRRNQKELCLRVKEASYLGPVFDN